MWTFIGLCSADIVLVSSMWSQQIGIAEVKEALREILAADAWDGLVGEKPDFDEAHLRRVFRDVLRQLCVAWSMHIGEDYVRHELKAVIEEYDWSEVERLIANHKGNPEP